MRRFNALNITKFSYNFQKKITFFGRTPQPTPMGVKFGVKESTFPLINTFMPNLTPIGAVCRPCGEKNLKIALVTELNTAAC